MVDSFIEELLVEHLEVFNKIIAGKSLIMAADPDRLEKLWGANSPSSVIGSSTSDGLHVGCTKDISFVGSLYNEKHNFMTG